MAGIPHMGRPPSTLAGSEVSIPGMDLAANAQRARIAGPQLLGSRGSRSRALLLQLTLEDLDLLGERVVGANQVLDLAHGMQDRGVIAATEAPPDLGQRAQR